MHAHNVYANISCLLLLRSGTVSLPLPIRLLPPGRGLLRPPRRRRDLRRRQNMVGVNMVLAEIIRFKHGLYKSCGVECVEGIMLEPYLLKPCFHVAGPGGRPASARRPAESRAPRPAILYYYYTITMLYYTILYYPILSYPI